MKHRSLYKDLWLAIVWTAAFVLTSIVHWQEGGWWGLWALITILVSTWYWVGVTLALDEARNYKWDHRVEIDDHWRRLTGKKS